MKDTKLFEQMIEASKTNRKGLIRLKNALVTLQQFELSVFFRDIETKCFPETEEVKNAKDEARKLNTLFRMVGLNISDDNCYLINETLKKHQKLKGKFSIEDAVKLQVKRDEIFEIS